MTVVLTIFSFWGNALLLCHSILNHTLAVNNLVMLAGERIGKGSWDWASCSFYGISAFIFCPSKRHLCLVEGHYCYSVTKIGKWVFCEARFKRGCAAFLPFTIPFFWLVVIIGHYLLYNQYIVHLLFFVFIPVAGSLCASLMVRLWLLVRYLGKINIFCIYWFILILRFSWSSDCCLWLYSSNP